MEGVEKRDGFSERENLLSYIYHFYRVRVLSPLKIPFSKQMLTGKTNFDKNRQFFYKSLLPVYFIFLFARFAIPLHREPKDRAAESTDGHDPKRSGNASK